MNIHIFIVFFILFYCGSTQRGYFDAPYIRYEADEAILSKGAFITPVSYNQSDIQSEASDKKCVDLQTLGAAISWNLIQDAEGLVIRFSVPINQTAILMVYADNIVVAKIGLSSYYTWKSLWNDSNPNNVGVINKNWRFRFDEVRYKFIQKITAGSVLKLQTEEGSPYIDFIELESIDPPIVQPNNSVNYLGNGSTLQTFIQANKGKIIYIPPGLYTVNQQLFVSGNNTIIQGAGMWYTQILFINESKGGVQTDGYNISLKDLYLTTTRNSRSNSYMGINGVFTPGSIIKNIWVEHFEVGTWIAQFISAQYREGPGSTTGLLISYSRFRNNYADGVNLAGGTLNTIVEHCSFRNNGDDDQAIWGSGNQSSSFNTFSYNTAELTWRAQGIGLYGGTNNTFKNIIIKDHIDSGIKVSNIFAGAEFSAEGMHNLINITVEGCGTFADPYNMQAGAVEVVVGQGAGIDTRNIQFTNVDIINSKDNAIVIRKDGGSGIWNVIFTNVNVNGTGKDFPYNNPSNINSQRGYGLVFYGYPVGFGYYDNLSFKTLGGNIGNTPIGDQNKGTFLWMQRPKS